MREGLSSPFYSEYNDTLLELQKENEDLAYKTYVSVPLIAILNYNSKVAPHPPRTPMGMLT